MRETWGIFLYLILVVTNQHRFCTLQRQPRNNESNAYSIGE